MDCQLMVYEVKHRLKGMYTKLFVF